MDASVDRASVTLWMLRWDVLLHLHNFALLYWSNTDSYIHTYIHTLLAWRVWFDYWSGCWRWGSKLIALSSEVWDVQSSSFLKSSGVWIVAFSIESWFFFPFPVPLVPQPLPACCLRFLQNVRLRPLKAYDISPRTIWPFFFYFFFLQRHVWRGATYVFAWWMNKRCVLSARCKLNTV